MMKIFRGGAYDACTQLKLRYSQVAPINMFEEKNTGNNLPAQIDQYSNAGDEFNSLFITKGCGSGNKHSYINNPRFY